MTNDGSSGNAPTFECHEEMVTPSKAYLLATLRRVPGDA